MKKGFIILLVLPLFFACSDIENCGTDQNLDFIILRFFDLETKESKKVGFSFTAENSPNRFVFFADTTIVQSDTTIFQGDTTIVQADTTIVSDSTFITLPLNPETNIATFFFDSDTSNHQLVLKYDKEFSILDPDCAPSLTFINLDTISQTFDSTVVVNPITNIFADTNIEIYF